jgi:hypothetical protein
MSNPMFDAVKKDAKKKKIEIITTHGENIVGEVTVKGDRRISDEINDRSQMFINITNAIIIKKGIARTLKHIGFNKANIESFYEVA